MAIGYYFTELAIEYIGLLLLPGVINKGNAGFHISGVRECIK